MLKLLFVGGKPLFSFILLYTIVLKGKCLSPDSEEENRLFHEDQTVTSSEYNMRIQENYRDMNKLYQYLNYYHDNNNKINSHNVFKRSPGENFPDQKVRKSLSRVCSSFYSNFPDKIQLLDEDWRQALEIVKASKLATKNNRQGSSKTKTKMTSRPDDDADGDVGLNTTGLEKQIAYVRGNPISKSRSKWGIPSTYVTRVNGRRYGKTVKVTLYVVHSEPITITTLYDFNHISKHVDLEHKDGENQTSPVLSKVYFNIDASRCDSMSEHLYYFEGIATFSFFSKGFWSDVYFVNIDICRFDKKEGEYADGSTKWIDTNVKKVTQKLVHIPPYRLLSDPGKTFFMKQGEDPTFDIELQLCRSCRFMINTLLWDHSKTADDGVVKSGVILQWKYRYNGQDSEIASIGVEPLELPNKPSIIVTVLNESRLNKTFFAGQNMKCKDCDERASNKQSDFDLKATIRLSIKIGSNELSGMLSLWYEWSERSWHNRPLVPEIEFTRKIGLKHPHRASILPRSWMKITNKKYRLSCDEDGNRSYQKYGKNCTIACIARGTDIKTISITKKQPGSTVSYQSVSQVVHGYTAFARRDLGPASDDIGGAYRCTVISHKGTIRHADMHLVTSNFPQIKIVTLEELENGTSKLELYVVGVAPLDIEIHTADVDNQAIERLDNDTDKVFVVESLNDMLNHAYLFINTNQLYLPSYYLTVGITAANGAHDYTTIEISHHINSYVNIYEIEIDDDRTGIFPTPTKGKVLLQCVASGHQSMQMTITMGGSSERYRIDNKLGTERTIEETDNTRILRVLVPSEMVDGDGKNNMLHCNVNNRVRGVIVYLRRESQRI